MTTMNKVKDYLYKKALTRTHVTSKWIVYKDGIRIRSSNASTTAFCMTTDRLVLDGRMTRSSMQEMKKTPKPGWTGLIEKLENRHSNFEIG
jgi:hypothetical protein